MRMQALLCTTIVSATKESLVYGLGICHALGLASVIFSSQGSAVQEE